MLQWCWTKNMLLSASFRCSCWVYFGPTHHCLLACYHATSCFNVTWNDIAALHMISNYDACNPCSVLHRQLMSHLHQQHDCLGPQPPLLLFCFSRGTFCLGWQLPQKADGELRLQNLCNMTRVLNIRWWLFVICQSLLHRCTCLIHIPFNRYSQGLPVKNVPIHLLYILGRSSSL